MKNYSQNYYKYFIKYIIFAIFVFLVYHLTIWFVYTSKIFGLSNNVTVGDLGRIAYQVDFLQPRSLKYTLKKKLLSKEDAKNQRIDIITMGDSFSIAKAGGINPYYQEYLATHYNLNIVNIHSAPNNDFITTIIGLYNNGTLRKIKPKAIIIETVQRAVIEVYDRNYDFSSKHHIYDITKLVINPRYSLYTPHLLPINNANYKFTFYNTYYDLSYKYKLHKAYSFKLKKDFFSSQKKNVLLVYKDDINNILLTNKNKLIHINHTFNKLARLLKKLNIQLYFMPASDKYNLYYPYITSTPYIKSQFFEIFRTLPKEYYFVDTEYILLKELKKGVQDLYYSDDTHWSYKASQAISTSSIFESLEY